MLESLPALPSVAPSEFGRILVAGLTFIAIMAAVIASLPQSPHQARTKTRLKRLKEREGWLQRRAQKNASSSGRDAKTGSRLRQQATGPLAWMVDRFSLRKLMETDTMRQRLSQAGLRGPQPQIAFLAARFVGAIALGGFGLSQAGSLSVAMGPAAIVGGFAVGYYAPAIWLENRISKRRQEMENAFPDALDLLLICVNAGMSIEAALHRVSGEVGGQSLDLAEELVLTTVELSYLPDRTTAFANFASRTGFAGARALSTTLNQTERYGTPVSQALRVLADENRVARLQRAEKKAAALPATLAVPVVAFFLPALFVAIIGPAVLRFMSGS